MINILMNKKEDKQIELAARRWRSLGAELLTNCGAKEKHKSDPDGPSIR